MWTHISIHSSMYPDKHKNVHARTMHTLIMIYSQGLFLTHRVLKRSQQLLNWAMNWMVPKMKANNLFCFMKKPNRKTSQCAFSLYGFKTRNSWNLWYQVSVYCQEFMGRQKRQEKIKDNRINKKFRKKQNNIDDLKVGLVGMWDFWT